MEVVRVDQFRGRLVSCTGEKIAQVPFSTAAGVDKAVRAAKAAFVEWRATPPLSRARYLFRVKEAFEEAFDEIAKTLVTEEGKTIDESRDEVRRMIENVEHATGVTTMMTGYCLEDIAKDIDCTAEHQPLGVFGCIAPSISLRWCPGGFCRMPS